MIVHYTATRRVEFADTDLAGIVHFANFYRYMEEAEHEFFRSLGIKLLNEQEDGSVISWPRVACSCNYKAPAKYEDLLEIRVTIARKGVKSLTMDHEFYRGEQLLATGQMKIVCCRFRKGEPLESIVIPDCYHERLPAAKADS